MGSVIPQSYIRTTLTSSGATKWNVRCYDPKTRLTVTLGTFPTLAQAQTAFLAGFERLNGGIKFGALGPAAPTSSACSGGGGGGGGGGRKRAAQATTPCGGEKNITKPLKTLAGGKRARQEPEEEAEEEEEVASPAAAAKKRKRGPAPAPAAATTAAAAAPRGRAKTSVVQKPPAAREGGAQLQPPTAKAGPSHSLPTLLNSNAWSTSTDVPAHCRRNSVPTSVARSLLPAAAKLPLKKTQSQPTLDQGHAGSSK